MAKQTQPSAARGLTEPAWSACNAAAKAAGLEPALVRAVCWVESRGNVLAVSPVGAQGLMQLMPATSRQLGVVNAFDAGENARGGAQYLGELLVRYGDVDLMLAAYNWGPGNVDKVKQGKAHLPLEVETYVQLVRQRWEVEKELTGPFHRSPLTAADTALPPPSRLPRSDGGSSNNGGHSE